MANEKLKSLVTELFSLCKELKSVAGMSDQEETDAEGESDAGEESTGGYEEAPKPKGKVGVMLSMMKKAGK